jgi:selenocysteine lyase/cysteine desulfurase
MSRPGGHPDLARWRADTPAVERLIHLNNAGASLAPTPVRRAVADHLELEAALGGYEAAFWAAAGYGALAAVLIVGLGRSRRHRVTDDG